MEIGYSSFFPAEARDLSIPVTPCTPAELPIYCLERKPVRESIIFVPGAYADFAPEDTRERVNGTFGMQMLSQKTGEPIAYCGFNIDGDDTVTIAHTPQGVHPKQLSRKARNELVTSGFRDSMMGTVVELAGSMGMREIIGVSSYNHPKVLFSRINHERGRTIMDDVYERLGFELQEQDLNYHRRLRATFNVPSFLVV